MAEALQRHMPEGTEWQRPQGGMFFWIELPEGIDAAALEDVTRSLLSQPLHQRPHRIVINGVHLAAAGEGKLVQKIYPSLFGTAAPALDRSTHRLNQTS